MTWDLGPVTCDLRPGTCDLRPGTWAWDLWPGTWDLRPGTCDLWPATCDLRFVPAGSSCMSPGIKFRNTYSQRLDKQQLKQLNSRSLKFISFSTRLNFDRSTWPARRKFERSNPQSVRTLSVDRPLFRALPNRLYKVKRYLTIQMW